MSGKKQMKYWRDMQDGVDYVYTPALCDDAIVDVFMLTYNHEPYIRQAIDSVLMQKTKYKYRMVIGDDCSPDNTQAILKEYQEKYPDKIATILWKYNTGKEFVKNPEKCKQKGCNSIVTHRYCTAKYIAVLEGDDYWTSPYKLEKAISFLEEHSEYIGYAHNIKMVDENGTLIQSMIPTGGVKFQWYPVLEEHIFCEQTVFNYYWLISQSAAIVSKNYTLSWSEQDWDCYYKCCANGDLIRSAILGCLGDVFVSRDIMSEYRMAFNRTSWYAFQIKKNRALLEYHQWINVANFLLQTYGIELPMDKNIKYRLEESQEALYRNFSFRNLVVYWGIRYDVHFRKAWKLR